MPLAVRRRAVSCVRSDTLQKNAPAVVCEGHIKSELLALTRCARTHKNTSGRCENIAPRGLFLSHRDPKRPSLLRPSLLRPSLFGSSTVSPQVSRGGPKTKKRTDNRSDLGTFKAD